MLKYIEAIKHLLLLLLIFAICCLLFALCYLVLTNGELLTASIRLLPTALWAKLFKTPVYLAILLRTNKNDWGD